MSTDLRLPLVATGLLGVLVSVRIVAWPLVRVILPGSLEAAITAPAADSARRITPESVTAIASRDPFRIGRRPVLPAYDPLRLTEQQAPPPPRPRLVLVGVVSGGEPSAVIEGLPGVEGSRVVRVGDVIAGLQIKQIANNRVVIAGMDTTWVLEVREPWKN